jgi:ribonuclease HI
VVPLDQASPSFREASFGPAAAAYEKNGIVVATDGSLRKNGAMGAAFVSKDNRLPARSVAVFGQPASIRPELAGLALPLEDCPLDEDLNILTDSQSSIDLLKALQRKDFPLWIRGHPARQLLQYVVKLVNRRADAGSVTRLIKVKAHRAEPLNEGADALAFAAAELDPTSPADLDPDILYFYFRGVPVQWDARLREALVQRTATQCLQQALKPRRSRVGQEGAATALPLTAAWMLRPGQGRRLLGKALEELAVSSKKRQVIRSIAGAFPCNALLAKWYPDRSAACVLCGHATETQSHIQCMCPALKEARIRAHHNLANALWAGISAAGRNWVIGKELTVAGLQSLNPPSHRLDEWYRAMDEVTDEQLEAEVGEEEASSLASMLRQRPDACAVSWEARKLFIMEFTRPNDKESDFSHNTDRVKSERYLPLKARLSHLLHNWEVDVLPFTIGIRGSLDEEAWKARLVRLGLTNIAAEKLMLALVKQALTELTEIYSIRQAALFNRQT